VEAAIEDKVREAASAPAPVVDLSGTWTTQDGASMWSVTLGVAGTGLLALSDDVALDGEVTVGGDRFSVAFRR
jgi:hypothetical protein